jgi:protein-L-isoaspartate(D-aspartate) O-methyltransferase
MVSRDVNMASNLPEICEKKKKLLDDLTEKGILSKRTRQAMENIGRTRFVPAKYKNQAYEDRPIEIGAGQTISAPHMYAIMTSAAQIEQKKIYNILEIGTGSGYQSAILAEILKQHGGGHVHTIERITSLANKARKLLNELGYGKIVTVHVADGSVGYPRAAPYDRILVTAGAPEIPDDLFDQLDEGGILIIPSGKEHQSLYSIKKQKGKRITKNLGGVAFVPLIGKKGWSR